MGAELDVVDEPSVLERRRYRLPGRNIPHAGSVVVGRRGEVATVRAKRDIVDPGVMCVREADGLTCRKHPQACNMVGSSRGGQYTVRASRDPVHARPMVEDYATPGEGRHVPHSNRITCDRPGDYL